METELLLALIAFAWVQSATPGPNNVMLVASSANFGIVRTLPHMMGIAMGLAVMLVLVGIGLAQVFQTFPVLLTVLQVVSAAYLLYLAYKIATAAAPGEARGGAPLTTMQAALFQWVNPKAWAMALGALTVYAPDASFRSALMVAMVVAVVSLPAMVVWVVAGTQVKRFLTTGRRLVVFNWTMAGLLVASLAPALLG